MIKIKRVYEAPAADDGARILVDRLWPRGLSSRQAQIDEWMKELAPSSSLRTWFGHEPRRWGEFKKRYVQELKTPEKKSLVADVAQRARQGTVTLLYAARDQEHNNASVLKEFLQKKLRRR